MSPDGIRGRKKEKRERDTELWYTTTWMYRLWILLPFSPPHFPSLDAHLPYFFFFFYLLFSFNSKIQVDETEVAEAKVDVHVPMDHQTALKEALKTSLFHDGLARGLREAVKALDRRQAHLCVLASSCNENAYKKLVTALCKEHDIPLIHADNGKALGEWVGLCRYDADGNAVKVVGCSCAVIKSWGEETEARQVLLEYIKNQQ